MEHPSLMGFLTDEIFIGLVVIFVVVWGGLALWAAHIEFQNMCDPFGVQRRRRNMHTLNYNDLVLEEGEQEDIEAYFEQHAVEWKRKEKDFSASYIVSWPNVGAASDFVAWLVMHCMKNHGMSGDEAVKYCKAFISPTPSR